MTTAATEPRAIAPAWRVAVQQAANRNRHQREIVLRYPAIAKRLTEPPLRLAEPRQWTGYIPGYWEAEDRHGRVRPNLSPIRAQLEAILFAACERADAETQAALPAPADMPALEAAPEAPADELTPPWRTQ